MKKINNHIFLVFCVFVFTLSVNALRVGALEPQTSYNIFPSGYGSDFSIDADVFDFSKIAFDSSTTGTSIVGETSLRKILSYYNVICESGDTECTEGEVEYFTAYCLDGNNKYPIYSSIYNDATGFAMTPEEKFKAMTVYQFFKECSATSSCTLLDDIDGYEGIEYTNIDTPDSTLLTSFDNDETVTSSLTDITITLKDPSQGTGGIKVITAAQMATALGVTFSDTTSRYDNVKYSFRFKKSDFNMNHYEMSAMPTTAGYNKALWIIEHSYPTLDLTKALTKAGTTLNAVKTDIETLEATTLAAISDPTAKEAKLNELVQDYVYSITQYAIWRSVGDYFKIVTSNKVTLGDTLVVNGSYAVPASLNTLYKYYIQDRSEYENYGTTNLTKSFTVTGPTSGSELYRTTTDAYVYGPYKVTGTTLYTNSINVSISSPTSGVTLIDEPGNPLTQINDGGNIYLKVLKSAKLTKVTLNLATTTGYVFKTPTSGDNRGRLFSSESKLDQVVATGGKIEVTSYNTTSEILLNPKTGVENIGTILLVILVAFTLGYVALRFKQDPVKEL